MDDPLYEWPLTKFDWKKWSNQQPFILFFSLLLGPGKIYRITILRNPSQAYEGIFNGFHYDRIVQTTFPDFVQQLSYMSIKSTLESLNVGKNNKKCNFKTFIQFSL